MEDEIRQIGFDVLPQGLEVTPRVYSNHIIMKANLNDSTVRMLLFDLDFFESIEADKDQITLERKPSLQIIIPFKTAKGLLNALGKQIERHEKIMKDNSE